jgi:hypothetical protein
VVFSVGEAAAAAAAAAASAVDFKILEALSDCKSYQDIEVLHLDAEFNWRCEPDFWGAY